MIGAGSRSVESGPGVTGCPKRLIWVAAIIAGIAVYFGAGAAYTLADKPTWHTATPEDPCLLNHTCGEETPGAVEELQAYCNDMKARGIFWIPECAQFN